MLHAALDLERVPSRADAPHAPDPAPREPVALVPWRGAARRGLSTESWVQLGVFALVTLLVASIPWLGRSRRAPATHAVPAAALAARLADLRQAIEQHHGELGSWPGSLAGLACPQENPLSGLSSVRMLAPTQPWPDEADETTGWIYRPATGELRANAHGTESATGRRLCEL